MPALAASSEAKLSTCEPELQRVVRRVVAIWPGQLVVLEGHRGEAAQNQYFDEGRSKKRWPDGEHNAMPSRAIDLVPAELVDGVRKIDWHDRERMTLLAGYVCATGLAEGVRIRWGGDWNSDSQVKDNSFDDLPHFELAR